MGVRRSWPTAANRADRARSAASSSEARAASSSVRFASWARTAAIAREWNED